MSIWGDGMASKASLTRGDEETNRAGSFARPAESGASGRKLASGTEAHLPARLSFLIHSLDRKGTGQANKVVGGGGGIAHSSLAVPHFQSRA